MSPSNSNAGMELPPPVVEQAPEIDQSKAETEKQAPNAVEKSPAGSVSTAMPTIPVPLPISPSPAPMTTIQDDDSAAVGSPIDKDLIDKEWVNKAKAIVDSTREDPYKQSENLTVLKADYMKKQFNKTLKLSK